MGHISDTPFNSNRAPDVPIGYALGQSLAFALRYCMGISPYNPFALSFALGLVRASISFHSVILYTLHYILVQSIYFVSGIIILLQSYFISI